MKTIKALLLSILIGASGCIPLPSFGLSYHGQPYDGTLYISFTPSEQTYKYPPSCPALNIDHISLAFSYMEWFGHPIGKYAGGDPPQASLRYYFANWFGYPTSSVVYLYHYMFGSSVYWSYVWDTYWYNTTWLDGRPLAYVSMHHNNFGTPVDQISVYETNGCLHRWSGSFECEISPAYPYLDCIMPFNHLTPL